MSAVLFQTGKSKIIVNDRIVHDKEYKFNYDGNKARYMERSNNKGKYVKLNKQDIKKLLNKSKNTSNLEKRLKLLLKSTKKKRVAKRKIKKKKTRKKKKTKKKQNKNWFI